MAIHEDVSGIEVAICRDGVVATEYEADPEESLHVNPNVRFHEDRWTVAKYIESITNETFSIKFTVHPHYVSTSAKLGFEVLIDGVRVWEPLVDSWKFERIPWTSTLKGAISGVGNGGFGTLRRFKFSKIETDSNFANVRDINRQKERMSQIGEITVKVHRYDMGYLVERGESKFSGDVPGTVHEKALKGEAKSHGISLGAAEYIKVNPSLSCTALDGHDFPIAIFKFKYRSREALKQLLIIERTPEPEPDLLDGLTADDRLEMQAMAERLRKRRREPAPDAKIKTEGDFIKREDGPSKRRRSGKSITIDLTGDSEDEETGTEDGLLILE